MPEENHQAGDDFYAKYQSLGSKCINHLSSKILISILPPSESFFVLKLDEIELKDMDAETEKAELDAELALIERSAVDELKEAGIYSSGFEIFKHLLVCGNTLVYLPDNEDISLFHLDSYIVVRDPSDNILEIITKEEAALDTLPEDVQAQLLTNAEEITQEESENVEIYTQIKREDNKWVVKQEIEGVPIDTGEVNSYPLNDCPWIPLRFWKVSGEAYGRAYCGDYAGDFRTYDKLSKAIIEGAALAAKTLFILDPGSQMTKRQLTEASSGDILYGSKEDLTAFQLEKYADFSFVANVQANIEKRLSEAFLLFSSLQRDAERVTAYELQKGIQELESVLGGHYTVLTKDFQEPILRRVLRRLKKKGKVPELPKDIVKIQITTGLQALGRGHDLDKLHALAEVTRKMFGEEAVHKYLKPAEFVHRASNALSINPVDLVKTYQELQEEENLEHQRQLALQKVGPAMLQQTEIE